MNRKSKIVRNGSVMYFRMVIIMLLNFYISRLAIKYLGADFYGLINIIMGVVVLFSFFTSILESTAQRYISQSLVLKEDTQAIVSTFLFINIAAAFLFSVIVYILGTYYIDNILIQSVLSNDVIDKVLIFSIISLFFGLISSPIMSIYVSYEKIGYYSLFTFLEVIFKFIFLYYIPFDMDEKVIYYSVLLLLSIVFSRGLACFCSLYIFKEIRLVPKLDLRKAKDIFSFTSWNLIGTMAFIANSQGTNLLINMFFALTVSASRAIAMQLNSAIIQVLNSVQMAINPQLFKSYTNKDYVYLDQVVMLNGRVICFLVSVICVVLVGNIDDLLTIWLDKYPDYLEGFIILMMIDVYIISQTSALVTLVQASGKIKIYQLVVGGTMVLNLPLSYYLTEKLNEPMVFYIVPILISFVCLFQRLFFVRKLQVINVMSYCKRVIVNGFLIIIFLVGMKILYKNHFLNTSIIFDIFISLLCTLILYYIINLSKSERKNLNEMMKNYLSNLRSS